MTTTAALLGFATASFAIALSPGPSWIYVISTTAGEGRRAGGLAVLGNGTGILCHVLAATLGLSALLEVSNVAYLSLRFGGAFYLIYLGLRMCFVPPQSRETPADKTPRGGLAIFRTGLLVNVLNPKMALLMFALLPQFIDPARGSTILQTFAIGCLHILIASAVLSNLGLHDESWDSTVVRRGMGAQRFVVWAEGSCWSGDFGWRSAALADRGCSETNRSWRWASLHSSVRLLFALSSRSVLPRKLASPRMLIEHSSSLHAMGVHSSSRDSVGSGASPARHSSGAWSTSRRTP